MNSKHTPELLEALKALVRHDIARDGREGMPYCKEVEDALRLIAQIEGENP